MTTNWCPSAIRNPAPVDGGAWIDDVPWRGVLHTTESLGTFSPHRTLYYGRAGTHPHFTVAYADGVARTWQHVPLNRAARAARNLAGGVETNRMRAVQIEIAWQAARAPDLPGDLADEVAATMRWIEGETGIPAVIAELHPYPPENGIRLGREPWRLTFDEWRVFTGWCGHQHVPENVHGDPGALPVERLRPAVPQPLSVPPTSPGGDMLSYIDEDGPPVDLPAGFMLRRRAGALWGASKDGHGLYAWDGADPALTAGDASWRAAFHDQPGHTLVALRSTPRNAGVPDPGPYGVVLVRDDGAEYSLVQTEPVGGDPCTAVRADRDHAYRQLAAVRVALDS